MPRRGLRETGYAAPEPTRGPVPPSPVPLSGGEWEAVVTVLYGSVERMRWVERRSR